MPLEFPGGRIWFYNQPMDISLISLRNALSKEKAKEVDATSAVFLSAINPSGHYHFYRDEFRENAPFLFFIESGGSEAPFIKIYQNYPAPYYLLTKGDSNSLASALEILSFLHQSGLEGKILYGSPKEIEAEIAQISWLYDARRKFSNAKLGVIGKPSDWLIASSVDYALAENRFSLHFVDISMDELKAEIDKHSYPKEHLPKDLEGKAPSKEVLEGALWIYGALKRLVEKYQLHGFTIRCFDLLGIYKNTSCLALALLNSEGVSAGCEGDEASLISMHLLRSLGEPAFQCNPSAVSIKDNTMVLAHCTLPLMMAKNGYSLLTHYESDLGIGVRGVFVPGKVTIFKIANNLVDFHLSSGEIVENLTEGCLCRSQIRVHFDNPVAPYLDNPYGNHLLLAYGNHVEQISQLLSSY